MTRVRMFGLCIVALLAIALAAAGSASAAAPEFGRCVKVAKGAGVFATGNCTSPGGEQRFQWIPGAGPRPQFTLTVKAEEKRPFLIDGVSSKTHLSCREGTVTGEITGPTTIGSLRDFTWKGCEGPSIGPEDGLIFAEVGSGVLGVWKAEATAFRDKVGLELTQLVYNCEIGGGLSKLHGEGDIIGQLGATNAMGLIKTLRMVVIAKGKQTPEKFDGEPAVSLIQTINGSPEKAVIAWSSTLTFAEKIEINTVV